QLRGAAEHVGTRRPDDVGMQASDQAVGVMRVERVDVVPNGRLGRGRRLAGASVADHCGIMRAVHAASRRHIRPTIMARAAGEPASGQDRARTLDEVPPLSRKELRPCPVAMAGFTTISWTTTKARRTRAGSSASG